MGKVVLALIPIPPGFNESPHKYYTPIGNTKYGPIAGVRVGVYQICISQFGEEDGKPVFRVTVAKTSVPVGRPGHSVIDRRRTDQQESIDDYQEIIKRYRRIAW